jgi:hypothetical protein
VKDTASVYMGLDVNVVNPPIGIQPEWCPPESSPFPSADLRVEPGESQSSMDAFESSGTAFSLLHPDTADAPGGQLLSFPMRGWTRRVNWRRTIAASLVLVLLEGVAFATAYWFVMPSETGFLLVNTTRPGVTVLINGRPRGQAPVSADLPPGRHIIELRGYGHRQVLPVEIAANVQTTQTITWPAPPARGALKVTSTPTGARVTVGRARRGATPLVIDDLPAGTHVVRLESDVGTVRTTVRIEAGRVEELDVPIFSGWITVFAPFEVRVFEGGRLIGTSNDGRLMLAPGAHVLDIVNRSLGFTTRREVTVEPGGHTALSIEAPRGTLQVVAPDGTEVLIDGELAGVMPLTAVKVPIGTRDVLLTHPVLGQRRATVMVTLTSPVRVEMAKLL